MSVNIAIVSWNALEYTKLCIESLVKYTSVPYYLTVVDNGSKQEVLRYLDSLNIQGQMLDLTIIKNSENLGYGKATLQACASYKTDFICLANNDLVFSEKWLEKLLAHFELHPRLALLGTLRPATFVKYPGSQFSTKEVVETIIDSSPLNELQKFCQGLPYDEVVNRIIRANEGGIDIHAELPSYLSTCCAVAYSPLIDRIGGLADLDFKGYGTEDIDLSWRITTGGYEIGIARDVYVHHFIHKSIQDNNVNRKQSLLRNNIKLYEKWKDEIWTFLRKQEQTGVDLSDKFANENDLEYWFLRRLNENVHFWPKSAPAT